MNIQIKNPGAVVDPSAVKAVSARDRAIAAAMGDRGDVLPVTNPNSISPEEMGAVKAKSLSEGTLAGDDSALSQDEESKLDSSTAEVEVPVAAEPAKPAEEPLSAQYALLARKEKALRAKVQAQELALKAKEEAFVAREAAIKAKEAEYSSQYISKDRVKASPLEALNELGLSYDDLTNAAASAPSAEQMAFNKTVSALEAKIAKLEEGQNNSRKSFEEQQQASYTQALNSIKGETLKLVSSNPEFETIKETNSVQDVVDLIADTFKNGLDEARPKGTLLSVEEAAQMVEDYLVEEALKLSRIGKIQKRLMPATPIAATTKSSVVENKQTQTPPMKTLTNAAASSRKLTPKERAILAFKGELKS